MCYLESALSRLLYGYFFRMHKAIRWDYGPTGSFGPEVAVEQKHPKAAVDPLAAGLPSKQHGLIVRCLPTGEL